MNVTGLTPSTSYTVIVIGRNAENTTSSAPGSTAATLVATPTQTLSNITSTGISVTIGTATNSSAAQYSIQFGDSYVQANGTLAGGQIWQTAAVWGAPVNVTGLTPSTSYTIQIIAKNPDGSTSNGTSTGTTEYTLANVPTAPTVTAVSSTSINAVINENSNPAATEFSIQIGSNYVQANGTLNTTQVWQTKAAWGGSSGVAITGLSANTAYAVGVIARNINPTPSVTAASSTTIRYTQVNAPTMTMSSVTTNGATLTIGENSNPAETTYAIAFTINTVTRVAADSPAIATPSTLTYLQADKTIGATAAYQTAAVWANPVLTNLVPVTSYTVQTIAKNGDNDVTNGASTTTQFETLANPPSSPAIGASARDSLTVTWSTNRNNNDTRYFVTNSNGNTSGWIAENSWANTRLSPGQRYDYTIKAKNMSGSETSSIALTAMTVASDIGGGGGGGSITTPTRVASDVSARQESRQNTTTERTDCQTKPPKISTLYEYGKNFPLDGSEVLTFDLSKANNITHYWNSCREATKYELQYSGNNFRENAYVKVWEGKYDNVGIAGMVLGKQLERIVKSNEGKIAIRIRAVTEKENIDGVPLELRAEIIPSEIIANKEKVNEERTDCQTKPPKISTLYEYGKNFPLDGSEVLTFDLSKANNITHYWNSCREATKYELQYSGNNFRENAYVKVWEGKYDNVGIAGMVLGKQLERIVKSNEGKIAIRIRAVTEKENIDGEPLEVRAEILSKAIDRKLVEGIIKIETPTIETPTKDRERDREIEKSKDDPKDDADKDKRDATKDPTREPLATTDTVKDNEDPRTESEKTTETKETKENENETEYPPETKVITLQIGKTISLEKEKEEEEKDTSSSGGGASGGGAINPDEKTTKPRVIDGITRGEFLAAVVEDLELKILHKNVLTTASIRRATKKFDDVKSENTNYQNIAIAANIGLTDGITQMKNKNLDPQNYITKAEAVRVMLIALEEIKPQTCSDIISEAGSIRKLQNSETPFADIAPGKIDKCWYPKIINRACEIGIIDCKKGTNFKPKSFLTKIGFTDLLNRSKTYAVKIGLKDKFTKDTDSDGIIDIFEKEIYKTNPYKTDTDGDLLNDGEEISQYKTDPLKADTDGDGINDGEEVLKFKTNPLKVDTDGDGFSDKQEVTGKTDALNPESILPDDNSNKVDDVWERRHSIKVKDGEQDTDKDGLSDKLEYQIGTNPNEQDTDKDNLTDPEESLDLNTDPLVFTLPEEVKVQIVLPAADQIVTTPNPLFKGIAKPGSKIEIALRNEFGIDTIIVETQATENGVFIVQAPLLQNGRYIFVAREINQQTNIMRISEPAPVRIDTTFAVKTPEADSLGNTSLRNLPETKESEILVNTTVPLLRGQTDFGNQVVTVWKSAARSASLIADSSSGNFEIRPPERLAPGPHEVIIYSIKKENNAVSEVLKIKFKVLEGSTEDVRLITYQKEKGPQNSFTLDKTSKPFFFNLFIILLGSGLIAELVRQYRKRKKEEEGK